MLSLCLFTADPSYLHPQLLTGQNKWKKICLHHGGGAAADSNANQLHQHQHETPHIRVSEVDVAPPQFCSKQAQHTSQV